MIRWDHHAIVAALQLLQSRGCRNNSGRHGPGRTGALTAVCARPQGADRQQCWSASVRVATVESRVGAGFPSLLSGRALVGRTDQLHWAQGCNSAALLTGQAQLGPIVGSHASSSTGNRREAPPCSLRCAAQALQAWAVAIDGLSLEMPVGIATSTQGRWPCL